jgi:RNA polymerase sigma-70 factor (ECF subfamily)
MEFAQIIEETRKPVLAAIRRYLDSRFAYAIDDVAQEVYIRAYRALKKNRLEDDTKLRSYLYTIAKNESLRMNQRCKREETKAERFLAAKREKLRYSEATLPESFDERDALVEALATLPDHYARVVELTLLGFTAREIVDKLDIKPGTVKSRLSRGLNILKQKLA